MYGDLVLEFAEKGHNVFVVAPLLGEGKTFIQKEKNINILWVKTMTQLNVGLIKKTIANIILPLDFSSAIIKYFPNNIDLIITPTPPITFYALVHKLKKRFTSKFFLILRDIFPQNAVDLGLMRKGVVYKIFRRQEKKLYEIADGIGCMSQGNIEYIKLHNPEIDYTKLVYLPNWLEPSTKGESDINVIEKYGLKNKFIVLFGGNLGVAQQPENVLKLAQLHNDKKDILFLIIGKGVLKKEIEIRIRKENISNVKLLDYIPRNEYDIIARYCKIGLVSLSDRFSIPNIPSRTLGYWSVGLPVFAMVDKNTDCGEALIEKHNGGICCLTGDTNSYINKFNQLYYNTVLREQMGLNGEKALFENYNTKRIYEIISNNIL